MQSNPYTKVTLRREIGDQRSATETGHTDANGEHEQVGWGQATKGLRCKTVVQPGAYKVGQEIPTVIAIENLGTTDAGASAQLFPHLDVRVTRSGWRKHQQIKLAHIKNRLLIRKGETFTYRFDLSSVIDLDIPGRYCQILCMGI